MSRKKFIPTIYGFDLDDTLSLPAVTKLCNDLFEAGHEIYVLSGGWDDPETRKAYLNKLGVKYTEFIRCADPDIRRVGFLKAKAIMEKRITVFFEDADLFIEAIKATCDVQIVKIIQ